MSSPKAGQARFFVALLPPPPLQEQITAIKLEVWNTYHSKAALRSPPHITLQPPFLWHDDDINRLKACLAEFAHERVPIPVTLKGFGAFPPRVIYVAVGRQEQLMTVQTELMAHLEKHLGLVDKKAKSRPFSPHMTVAFRDLKPPMFRQAWPQFESRPFDQTFIADALTLLRHDGQQWQVATNLLFKGQFPD